MTATTCPKITKALHEVMQKCAYVQKGGHNKFHNYRYAGESDLLAVLRPAMVEAGLLLLPSVTEAVGPDEYGNTTVKIAYTLAHKDGEVWPEPIYAMGCGNDKNSKGGIGDKGTYKAITGANKYLLFKLFQIETGDDPETEEHDAAPPAPRAAAKPQSAKPASVAPAEKITLFLFDGEFEEFAKTTKGVPAYINALDDLVRKDSYYWKQNAPTAEDLAETIRGKAPDLAAQIDSIRLHAAGMSKPNTVLGAG